jgi:FkbM family methyltransferase
MNQMLQHAKELGFDTYRLEQAILSQYQMEVLSVYDLLEDERSREVYEEIVTARMEGRYPKVGTCSPKSYFCWSEFAQKEIGRVFVDCGSYTGETIEQYLWETEGWFDQVIAFEPDEVNYQAMEYRLERLKREWNVSQKIEPVYAGVGGATTQLCFQRNENGVASNFIEKGDQQIQIYALDDYLKEPYTFLKADIESFEYEMLEGARNTIKKWEPHLAICIYHNCVDIFAIALLIRRINPRYRIAVRHHSTSLVQTVLYAWVEE